MAKSLSSNDVISAITSNLLDSFEGEITTVYKDTPVQGMIKPCFFIQQLEAIHNNQMRNTAIRTYFLDVRAHPPDSENNKITWCNNIGFKLMEVLESIYICNELVRATSIRYEIQEEVLHFFVEYSFKVVKVLPPETKMETLETMERIEYGKRR